MTYKNQTYYWILPLNEGKWTIAKHIEGAWHFIDGRCRLTNDLGQIGEEIHSNDELFKQRRMNDEFMNIISELNDNIKSGHWSIRSSNPDDGQILFDLWEKVQQFIKKEN